MWLASPGRGPQTETGSQPDGAAAITSPGSLPEALIQKNPGQGWKASPPVATSLPGTSSRAIWSGNQLDAPLRERQASTDPQSGHQPRWWEGSRRLLWAQCCPLVTGSWRGWGRGILAEPGQPGPQEPRATDICQQVQLHLTMLTISRTPGPTHPLGCSTTGDPLRHWPEGERVTFAWHW